MSRRAWVLLGLGVVPALAVGWWLGSPLFLDRTVDEEFPRTVNATIPAAMGRAEAEALMEDAATEPPTSASEPMPTEPVAASSGRFQDIDRLHRGSGKATIYTLSDGSRVLRFEDFEVTNGPDLRVLLTAHGAPTSHDDIEEAGYVELGKLKGNVGNQNYTVPADLPVEIQRTVVIYCNPFSVVFSTAALSAVDPPGPTAMEGQQAPNLTLETVGNAGVALSDGQVTLLVDLPYESGAFGYQGYDPEALQPLGTVVSVITHHHRDHVAPELFMARDGWRMIGPPSVVSGLPQERVLLGDSVQVGAFAILTVPTPHTDDHRSYRIRWRGRVLYFVGDTEDAGTVSEEPPIDVLFVTPWLSCALERASDGTFGARSIAYHLQPDGSDRGCGPAERAVQGQRFTLSPAAP